jgi:lipopolysaccharide exporter
MSMRLSIAKGALSLSSARLVVNLINALGIVVLARLLTPNDFGIVAIATTVLTVVASFTEVSLQPALVQCADPTDEHVDTVWTMMLLRSLLIFTAFAAAAWPLSLVYGDPRLFYVFVLTGVTGAFYDFANPRIVLATRYMSFMPLSKFQIYQKLFALVLTIVLAVVFRNFWAMIIGNAIGAIASSLISYWIIPYRPRLTLSRASEIWGFSGWLFLNQICETLNWRFDQLAISFAVSKPNLGLYAMADNLAVIPTREMTSPMSGALFAGIVATKNKPGGLRRSFIRVQGLITMITAPLALGLAILARPAVLFILGERWRDCAVFVMIFAMAYLLGAFTSAVRPLAMAAGATRLIFIRQLIVLIIRIPLITAGLLAGGIVGAALARLCSSFIELLVGTRVAGTLIDMPFFQILGIHASTLIGLGAMLAVLLPIELAVGALHAMPLLAQLGLMVTIGGVTYVGAILLFWHLSGRPHGAVSELMEIVHGLFTAIRTKRAES